MTEHTILLVDDNKMFIEIQKEFLEYTNVEVLTAADGLAALEIMAKKRPSLVFMDLHMPRMDGAACCRAIKADPLLSSIPVVMITSRKEEDMKLCYEAQCDHFLPKPLDRIDFLSAARQFIPSIDRRERRVLVDIPATLQVNDVSVPCRLHDLSAGGAFVVTDFFGIPNSVIQISFTLPGGAAVQCHARIAWVNRIYAKFPKGLGIKFALMANDMKASLVGFLKSST